jgi:hypothetical protein
MVFGWLTSRKPPFNVSVAARIFYRGGIMFRPAFRALGLSALVSVFGFGTAHAFVINDFATPLNNTSYWGGDEAGGAPTGSDVIGFPEFEIFNANVTRTAGGVLTVVIKTNYVPGTLGRCSLDRGRLPRLDWILTMPETRSSIRRAASATH